LVVVEATGPTEEEKGVVGTKWLKPETGIRVSPSSVFLLIQVLEGP